jgi:cardiolipin synthase
MAVASSGRPAWIGGRLARLTRFTGRTLLRESANIVTLGRLLLALPIAWLIFTGNDAFALGLFVIASLSDAVDGFLAKRFNEGSSIGAILDPIADKLLVISVLIALVFRELIPFWLLIAIILRDFCLVLGTAIAKNRLSQFTVKPHILGKLFTFAIMLTIVFTLAAASGLMPALAPHNLVHVALAGLVVLSGIAYALETLRCFRREHSPDQETDFPKTSDQ